jgi:hypothetical protein
MTTTETRPPAPTPAPEHAMANGGRGRAWTADALSAIRLLRVKATYLGARERARVAASTASTCSNGESHREDLPPGRADEVESVLRGVDQMLTAAKHAACGTDPRYTPILGWWSGACSEAAFRHIHNAESLLARLYSKDEVSAGVLEAARRARTALSMDDPTRRAAITLANDQLRGSSGRRLLCTSEQLGEIIQVGHDAADKQRAKLRTFRNVVLLGTMVAAALLIGLVLVTASAPRAIPLCFVPGPLTPRMPMWDAPFIVCPTSEGRLGPSGGDVAAVALMGVLGGGLSAAVFIRGLYLNNSTPYNVAVPLALSKLPAGGMTSVAGMILLAGDFVPGFTSVDKQGQVLAYAILFGFAQQLYTQLLDRQAERLLATVPGKARSEGRYERQDGIDFAFVEFASAER